MALQLSVLKEELLAVFTAGSTPPPNNSDNETVMKALVAAYDTYAQDAQAPSGVPVSKANKQDLEDALIVSGATDPPYTDYTTPAQDWASAFGKYWDNAQFGATSTPPIVVTATLQSGMLGMFSSNAGSSSVTTSEVADQLATLLDTFTRSVVVGDTAVPPPSGTPPGPIS